MINRRHLLAGASAGLGLVAMPAVLRAQTRTVKMGSLRLIHSMTPHFYDKFAPANLKIEVITFDSPTDGKNAVVTKSVDFGGFGIAAAVLGAAAGEPVVVVGAFCNKGMGVIAKAGSDIKSVKDLKGKKVGIWPGSTQEVFIMERLRLEGISIKDVVRPRSLRRDARDALARRSRRLCRRGARPRPLALHRRRTARRIPLQHRDGRPEHDLRHARGQSRKTPSW